MVAPNKMWLDRCSIPVVVIEESELAALREREDVLSLFTSENSADEEATLLFSSYGDWQTFVGKLTQCHKCQTDTLPIYLTAPIEQNSSTKNNQYFFGLKAHGAQIYPVTIEKKYLPSDLSEIKEFSFKKIECNASKTLRELLGVVEGALLSAKIPASVRL